MAPISRTVRIRSAQDEYNSSTSAGGAFSSMVVLLLSLS